MTLKSLLLPLIALSALPVSAKSEHVIVISCDGMRPDAIAQLGEKGLPNLHRLIKEGAYTGNARTDTK